MLFGCGNLRRCGYQEASHLAAIASSVHTAILFFARSARAEARAKAVLPGRKRSMALWQRLRTRQLELARQTGATVYDVHEGLQRGEGFRERLSTAIREVAANGHERILVLGSDCPQLNAGHLERAMSSLHAGQHVIGHDRNGGCYLFGFQVSQVCLTSLEALPWETAATASAVETWLGKSCSLPILSDLNSSQDVAPLRHVFEALGWEDLLTASRHAFSRKPSLKISRPCGRSLSLRGPPKRIRPASALAA